MSFANFMTRPRIGDKLIFILLRGTIVRQLILSLSIRSFPVLKSAYYAITIPNKESHLHSNFLYGIPCIKVSETGASPHHEILVGYLMGNRRTTTPAQTLNLI